MEGTGVSDATLAKDDQGVWSITVGPLVPDFYAYSFTVDGVRTLDPRKPLIEPGIDENDSMFEVPGQEATFEDNKPGPHGDIRMVWYPSSTLDSLRRMHIYTPLNPRFPGGRSQPG